MQISIRTFEGKTITVEVEPNGTILNVKTAIQTKEGIRTDLQRLVFANEPVENGRLLSSYGVREESILYLILRSADHSNTVAGGYGQGNATNQFCFPYGLVVDDDQTMVIADWGNHRIIKWKAGDINGQVIAGGQGQGNRLDQLSCPTDVLIDKETDSLIICDRGNSRVLQWSRRDGTTQGEILLDNIACWGVAMDQERCLYISNIEKDEVRRYQMGEKNGTLVAGGRGRGAGLNQLNAPGYIFVDQQKNVYVSDTRNQRVMKWNKDATQVIVAARGFPRGLFVDTLETIYVADYGSHRLMCWPKGATQGTVIVGASAEGEEASQLYYPWGLSFHNGHLYVADHSNHRVQRFSLEQNQ